MLASTATASTQVHRCLLVSCRGSTDQVDGIDTPGRPSREYDRQNHVRRVRLVACTSRVGVRDVAPIAKGSPIFGFRSNSAKCALTFFRYTPLSFWRRIARSCGRSAPGTDKHGA